MRLLPLPIFFRRAQPSSTTAREPLSEHAVASVVRAELPRVERLLGRMLGPRVDLEDLVQTDAAVNNGDSGGSLVNLAGEFVGLLTTVVR